MKLEDQNLAIAKICMLYGRHAFRLRNRRSGATEIGANTGWVFPWYDPAKHPPTFIMPRPPYFCMDGTAMRQAISLLTDPEKKQAYIGRLSHHAGIRNDDQELDAIWKLLTATPQIQARAYLEAHNAWVQDPVSNGHHPAAPAPQPDLSKTEDIPPRT